MKDQQEIKRSYRNLINSLLCANEDDANTSDQTYSAAIALGKALGLEVRSIIDNVTCQRYGCRFVKNNMYYSEDEGVVEEA
jgi:hypothetical protein